MPEICECSQCGAPLPEDAPPGLCRECRLAGTIAPEADSLAGFDATVVRPTPEAVPTASLDEVARHFSELEILEVLGKGGMGLVFRARQRELDRIVALKVLLPEISHDPAFSLRFSREARALAKLNHPGVVAVHDVGQRGGLYYLLMEYVDGANLRHVLKSGRMSATNTLQIASQICDALQFAHDAGVIHRDVKPANILITSKGQVKIADFGLAKLVGQPSADSALTGPMQIMGTLHYMAPEQMERPLEVDHRADIYSLGVVLYEMLTGELPIGHFALPSQIASADAGLDKIVLRALTKAPAGRFQQVSELKTALEDSNRPAAADSSLASTPADEFDSALGDFVGNQLERIAQSASVSRPSGNTAETYGEKTRAAIRNAKSVIEGLALEEQVERIGALWRHYSDQYGIWFGITVALVLALILGLSVWTLLLALGALVAWRYRMTLFGRILGLGVGSLLYIWFAGQLHWLYQLTGRDDVLFAFALYGVGGVAWGVWLWKAMTSLPSVGPTPRSTASEPGPADNPSRASHDDSGV